MKNYDYKDEQKDVKGKVSHRQKSKIQALGHLISYFLSKIVVFAYFLLLMLD